MTERSDQDRTDWNVYLLRRSSIVRLDAASLPISFRQIYACQVGLGIVPLLHIPRRIIIVPHVRTAAVGPRAQVVERVDPAAEVDADVSHYVVIGSEGGAVAEMELGSRTVRGAGTLGIVKGTDPAVVVSFF